MRDIYEVIEEKIKRRDEIEKLIRENRYPKFIYKRLIKELNEIKEFFSKYGRDIY